MKFYKLFKLLLVLCFPMILQGQHTHWGCTITDHSTPPSPFAPCPSTNDPPTSENGRHLTPRDTFRTLVLYAGFTGHASTKNHFLDGWSSIYEDDENTPDLPDYLSYDPVTGTNTAAVFFNHFSDFDSGGPIDDPENKSASKIWNVMSKPNQDFKLIGEVFSDANGVPRMVVVDPYIDPQTGTMWTEPCDFPNTWGEMNRLVIQNASLMNPQFDWGRFDQRENAPQYQCDNSLDPASDGVIDYVIVIYKYINSGFWDQANVSSLTNLVGAPCGDRDTVVQTSWQGSGGGIDGVNIGSVDLPNLNQTIDFDAGFTLAKGVGDHNNVFFHEFSHTAYHCPHFFSGNNVAGDYFYKYASGWGATAQRPVFSMMTAWERWYLGYIDERTITQNGIYELDDYVMAGDAIRIEIPHSGGQHLWIENHTGIHELDAHPKADDIIGPNGEQLSNSPSGIYMYVENIAGDKGTLGFNNVAVNGANGVKFLNAAGNHDYIIDTSVATIDGTYRSIRGTANPLSGIDPMLLHRDDYNGNGEIIYSTDWNGGGNQEHRAIEREYHQSIDKFLYRNTMADTENILGYNDHGAAFQIGDIVGISTNPSITNYTRYSTATETFEPTMLNGLRIEVIDIDAQGKATLDIQFEATRIDQNLRWTGDIILPNITDNSADLIIGTNRKLTLNLGGTADRETISPITGTFVNPTAMRITSDAELLMEESSNLTVQKHSTLIIEDGAKVLLENAACIVVQDGGVLELQGNDITLNGTDAVIQIQQGGTLRTADGVDFTFKGNGYVSFDQGNIVDLGVGSNFVLEKTLLENGRFIQLNEAAVLTIAGEHDLILKHGEVIYKSDSKIVVDHTGYDAGQVNLFGVHMVYGGVENGASNVIGVENIGMGTIVAKYGSSKGLGITFKIDGEVSKNGWIYNNDFTTNDIGIIADQLDHLMIYDNDFRDIFDTAIKLSHINFAVAELNTIEEAQSNYSVAGIDLNEVGFASISNGYIQDCLTGVSSRASNVFLREGVVISDNMVGIDFGMMENGDYALTIGDKGCASVINNDVGVKGKNIILNIDAIEHATNNGGTPPQANRFDGNTTLFDICYTDPVIVNANPTILMKGNYWGGGSFFSNQSNFKIDLIPGDPECETTVSIDDSEFVTVVPANCDWIMSQTPQTPTPTKVKCQFKKNSGETVLVHEQARLAFIDLALENFSEAKSKYQPIADLSEQEVSYEAACLHKIFFARCMVDGLGDSDGFNTFIARLPNEESNWQDQAISYNKPAIENFTIFPNPANDFILIRNTQNVDFEVSIYNTFGERMLTKKFTKELNLDVEIFESGIYILDILDMSTKESIQKKIVIQ